MNPNRSSMEAIEQLRATAPGDRLPLMFDYLATTNKERNELAAHLFVGLGPSIVSRLVLEAISKGKRAPHRIRLLDIVIRIGTPLAVDDWMSLYAATHLSSEPVRQKIVEVFARLRHTRTPDVVRRMGTGSGVSADQY